MKVTNRSNGVSQYIVAGDKNTKVELSKVEFSEDEQGYYLDLTYTIEDDRSIQTCHIPRLRLPIHRHDFNVTFRESDFYLGSMYYEHVADIGFGEMKLLPDKGGNCYYVTLVEEKTKEMTLAEIEKKLGHKVKIVNR